MNRGQRTHTIDTVFVLVLFCAFAAASLLTLMIGANVYRGETSASKTRYEERTCLSYIAAKVRHSDAAGAVSVEPFGGETALCLRETVDGTDYVTRIYSYDGGVRELFSEEGLDFAPSDGETILSAGELSFALDGRLLRVSCASEDGGTAALTLFVRAAEGGGV